MTRFTRKLLALSFVATFAASPMLSHADAVGTAAPDYTVFLDPPTGFVFVKLPVGWKFVGKVDARDVAQRPPRVVTALVASEGDSIDIGLAAQTQPR